MSKRNSGSKRQENAVNSVAEIPLAIISAISLIEMANDGTRDREEQGAILKTSGDLLDSVMTFIAGPTKPNLGELALTEGQQEYLRYVFEQFAKGEEIAALNVAPIIVSMV